MSQSPSDAPFELEASAGGNAPGKTAAEILNHSKDTARAVAADLVSPEERHLRISRAAYSRAEARGFAHGADFEDWLAAEREIDAELDR